MWVAYSNKGTRIDSDFWDWCCMEKVIADYKEEFGLTDEEAHVKFWEDVKNHYPEDFAETLEERTIAEAIADVEFWDSLFMSGWADEIRADYLYTLDIDCKKIEEA